VDPCTSSQEAINQLAKQGATYQVILLDWMLESPEASGMVVEKARGISPDFPVIVFTGDPNDNSPSAIQKGASWYIRKPFDLAELKAIIQSLTEQEMSLRIIARTAREVIGSDQFLIWHYYGQKRELKLAAWADSSSISDLDTLTVIGSKNRNIIRMLRNEKPTYIDNIQQSSKYHSPQLAARHNWNHVICVPLRYQGKEFGFIESYSRGEFPLDQHPAMERIMLSFARQVAESINNSELAQKNRLLINSISSLTAEQPKLEKFTEAILKIGIDLADADDGWFYIFNFENEALQRINPSGQQKMTPSKQYKLGEANILCAAIREGTIKVVSDIKNPGEQSSLKPLQLKNYRSQIAIPLRRGDLSIGAVILASRIPGAFRDGDLDVLRSFTALAGSALDQAKLRFYLQRISQAVLKGPDVLQNAVIQAIQELLGKAVALWLWDEEKAEFIVPAALGVSENFKERAHIGFVGLDDSLIAHAFLTKQPVNCGDLDNPEDGLTVKLDDLLKQENWKSTLIVPIFDSEEKPVGAIAVKRDVVGKFNQYEVDFLSNFTSQVAIAFENHRRGVSLSQQLETFQEIIRRMGSTETDPLPIILERSAKLLRAEYGSFALLDRANERLVYKAVWQKGEVLVGDQIPENYYFQALSQGIAGYVARSQADSYYAPDLSQPDPYYLKWYDDTVSELTVSLKDAQGAAIGILNLESTLKDAFSLPQRELCQTLAQIAADVVERSELFARTERLNNQLQVLHDAVQERDLHAILRQVLLGINELYGSQTCSSSITLFDDHEKRFLATIVAIGPVAGMLRFPPREERGIGWYVANHRKPLYVESKDQLPAEITELNPRLLEAGIMSSAALPLMRQGQDRLLGVMFIHEMQPTMYPPELRRILRIYANQAAIAIENALAFEQRKNDLDSLREVVNAIGTANPLPLVLEKAVLMLEADHGHISTVEDKFLVLGAFWQNGKVVSGEEIPENMRRHGYQEGISGHVVKTGKPYYAQDLSTDSSYYLQYFEDTRSELTVPLKDETGAVIGVLNLESRHVDGFPPPKQALCESFAEIAADVLSKERLYRRLGLLNQQLDTLHAVTQGTKIDDIAIQILKSINDILGSETTSSSMLLYDQSRDEFPLCKAAGPLKEHLELPPRKRGGKARFMLGYRRPLFEQDVLAPPDHAPRLREDSLKLGIKSSAILPLMRGSRVLGILFVHQTKSIQFDDQMRKLLIRFADQAAVVIESNQIYEKQVDYLESLLEINAAIGKEKVDAIYQKIVQKTRDITGGTASSLWILNKADNLLEIGAVAGPEPNQKKLALDHHSINGHVAITRRPYICKNVAGDPYYLTWYPEIQSSLTIPMMYGTQLIGTLDVESTMLSAFTEDQMKLLQALGNLAAIALTNAQSYERRVNDIVALGEINAAVGEKSPQEIQQMVVTRAVELTDADYSVLWQLHETGKQLDLLAIKGREPIEQSLRLEPDTIHGKVVQERHGCNDGDVLKNPNYRGWYPDINSHLQVPMFAGEKLVGTLQVESTEKDAFTEDQMNVLQALANQAAVAMEKDRWLKDLGRLNGAGRSISSVTASVPAVLERASQESMQLLMTAATAVWLYDSSSGELVCEYATPDLDGEHVDIWRLKPGEGLVGRCYQKNENLIITDAFQDRRQYGDVEKYTKAGFHSIASIPLRSEDRVIGVLQVLHEAIGYFQQSHIALLEPLAAFTAHAIESARQIERLQFINDLGKELTSLRIEQEIFETVHHRAKEIMYTDNMFIALYDSRKNEISFPRGSIDGEPIGTTTLSTWKRPFGNGLTEAVIKGRNGEPGPLLMTTKRQQEHWYKTEGKNYIGKIFASWLGVPILYANQVLGVIATYHSAEEYKFSEDDKQVLTLIAGQMAVALKNLREMNALQTLSDNLLKETTSIWEAPDEPVISTEEKA
jgi:GAF domain-containing protein